MLFQNNSLSLVFSLFLLCLLGAYPFLHQILPNQGILSKTDKDPDVFATGVTAFYLNREGNLETQFESQKMLHYDAQNKTDFEKPHFWVYGKSPVPWHIFALHGQATFGIDTIELWDNVTIHQDRNKKQQELNLKTSVMMLYPKIQVAETNQAVVLNQPGYQISAMGVRLSLKDEKLDLISQAKGEFMPSFLENPNHIIA